MQLVMYSLACSVGCHIGVDKCCLHVFANNCYEGRVHSVQLSV